MILSKEAVQFYQETFAGLGLVLQFIYLQWDNVVYACLVSFVLTSRLASTPLRLLRSLQIRRRRPDSGTQVPISGIRSQPVVVSAHLLARPLVLLDTTPCLHGLSSSHRRRVGPSSGSDDRQYIAICLVSPVDSKGKFARERP